ncbi:MAG: thiol-disulfide oxidoreductase [Planctomycetaceae bacterium]|nr:thiol-disulfide oxidoreductase [Planctomycetaceae bacterium]
MTRTFVALSLFAVCIVPAYAADPAPAKAPVPELAVGDAAPTFKIKDASGKVIDLADLTAKGPVLVRLTCGCSGCDKELSYFKEINAAYKDQGLTSLLIFKEPDEKMAKYAVDKKLSSMLYAVDSKGESWKTFQTTKMPTNFLIAKGGKISSIAAGCDPSGLLANKVSEKAAKVIGAEVVNVQKNVDTKAAADKKTADKKATEEKTEKK